MMPFAQASVADARQGDWLEVDAVGGGPPRRGQILEVLGRPGHRHFRVRWDEQHEALHFPAQGTRRVPAHATGSPRT